MARNSSILAEGLTFSTVSPSDQTVNPLNSSSVGECPEFEVRTTVRQVFANFKFDKDTRKSMILVWFVVQKFA